MLRKVYNNTQESRVAANFGILLLAVSFITGFLPYAYSVIKHGGSAYQSGDWLINYEGGFVRRGLIGQLILIISPNGTLGLIFLLIIQTSFYFLVFVFFAYTLVNSKSSWIRTVLICSPSGLCFSGWDIGGFGRKEIIGYAVLILLSIRANLKQNLFASRILVWASFIVFIIGVLSWEPIALFLPFILFLIRLGFSIDQHLVERKLTQSFFVVFGLLGFLLSINFKGTPKIANEICTALRNNGFNGSDICSGAINAIGWTSSYTLNKVQESFPLYIFYLPLFALAVAPLVLSRVLVGLEKFALISFFTISPLFFVVNDYGRWISLYYVSIVIILIASNRIESCNASIMDNKKVALLFLLSWGLPHVVMPNSTFPIKGAIVTPVEIFFSYSLVFKIVYAASFLFIGVFFSLLSSAKWTRANSSSK